MLSTDLVTPQRMNGNPVEVVCSGRETDIGLCNINMIESACDNGDGPYRYAAIHCSKFNKSRKQNNSQIVSYHSKI